MKVLTENIALTWNGLTGLLGRILGSEQLVLAIIVIAVAVVSNLAPELSAKAESIGGLLAIIAGVGITGLSVEGAIEKWVNRPTPQQALDTIKKEVEAPPVSPPAPEVKVSEAAPMVEAKSSKVEFDRYAWIMSQNADRYAVRILTGVDDNPTLQEIALTKKEIIAALLCGVTPTPPPPLVVVVRMSVQKPTLYVRSAPGLAGTILRTLKMSENIDVEQTTTTADKIIWHKVANEAAYIAERAVDGSIIYLRPT